MVADPAKADVKSKNARVFISYSRKDMTFVDRLEVALKARNIEPLIDRTEIYAFEDWWKRIEALIVAADTIVFVLSPNAVASDICAKEVTFAASLNKRFAPIVCEPVDDKAVPEPLRRLHFIFFTDSERFDERIEQLAEALRTDITWIRRHTEFGEQARRWSEAGRPGPRGLLLRPPILDEAERWIAARPREAPEPTEAMQAFIAESRRASTRRRNILTGGLAAGLLVALGLAGFAYWQRAVAIRQEKLAVQQEKLAKEQRDRAQLTQSRFLADLASQRVAAGDPSRALLFALEGMPDSAGGVARPYAPETEFALFRARQRLQEVQQFDGGPARLSRDGSRIITAYAGYDTKGAAVWDAGTGKLIARLSGHTDQVLDADLSPDARLAVTASADRTARIWDVASARPLATLNGHSALVTSAAFSPDGKRVATASNDGTARIWHAESGVPIAVLNPSIHSIWRATFSPDGQRVMTRGTDGTVRVWDAGSGKEIVALRGHSANQQEEGVGDIVWVAEFSPDGRRVLTSPMKSTARVWDAQTGRAITTLTGHTAEIVDGKFSPDGRRIVTASWDKTARIWDATSGKSLAVLQGHGSNAIRVAFSPDGRRVATASSDATRVWDAQSGNIISRFEGENTDPTQVQFSPDGRRVITSAVGRTRTWEIDDRQPVVTLSDHQGAVQDNAFSPDGRLVVTASADKTARIWEAQTGKVVRTLTGHEGPVSRAAFSADGQRVVTASGTDQTARIWDVQTGRTLTTLRDVTTAALSPDGKRAVTTSSDKKARVWDLGTGKVLRVFDGHDTDSIFASLSSVAFSPDGRRVASGGSGQIFVWDAETAAVIASLPVDSSALDVSFSPDGRRIACGCNYSANIWDVDTQQLVSVLKHTGVFGADPNFSANFVATARFSPDGMRVATGTHNTARIWDAKLAKPIAFFGGAASGVWNPAFSPDGRFLIVPTGGSTMAKIWTIFPTTQALVDDAKTAIPRCLTRQQREEAFLDPEPPAWCIEMGKWPYGSQDWKDWLKYKRSDAAPPLPDAPEWQSWAASRK
jgi:WD40 repeat protein